MLAGGSLSNIQAIALARNRILGSFEKGLMGLKRKPYIFASEASHTSIEKAAMVLGLGTNSVVPIETDKDGKMNISNLDKSIKQKIDKNLHTNAIMFSNLGCDDSLETWKKANNNYT